MESTYKCFNKPSGPFNCIFKKLKAKIKPLTMWITTNCGKFLNRWEYQTTLSVSWETCMQDKKQQLEPHMEQLDWFKIGKGVRQGCILPPCLFNLYAECIMQNARLDEAQAGIKIAARNTSNLRYADNSTLMEESEEELKNLLMKVKEESEKAGLKLKGGGRGRFMMGNTCMPVADSCWCVEEPIQYCKVKKKKIQHSKNKDHGIQFHYFMANKWGNNGNSDRLYFLRLQNHCRWWLQPWN